MKTIWLIRDKVEDQKLKPASAHAVSSLMINAAQKFSGRAKCLLTTFCWGEMSVLSLYTKLNSSRIAIHIGKMRKERHYGSGSQPVGHGPSGKPLLSRILTFQLMTAAALQHHSYEVAVT